MSSEVKIPEEVVAFIRKCSAMVVKFEEEQFESTHTEEIIDGEIDSPIEQLLYVALETVLRINLLKKMDCIDDHEIRHGRKGFYWIDGILIERQVKIGRYRVDFVVCYAKPHWIDPDSGYTYPHEHNIKEVIVECDSQQWHERTEKERRYEKQRDRYFASLGRHVFHFTGKEITEDALKVAGEIIEYLISYPVDTSLDTKEG